MVALFQKTIIPCCILVDLLKSLLGVVMTYTQKNQANTCEVVFLDKSERYFWLNSDFIEGNFKHKKRRTNSCESILRFSDLGRVTT